MAIDYDKLYKEISVARIKSRKIDTTGKIWPSSLGDNCELALRYLFEGATQEKKYTHHGKENKIGDKIHDEIQKDLTFRFGDKVEIEAKIKHIVEEVTISGKIDAILNKQLIIEIKSISQDDFDNKKKFDAKHRKYIRQVQWYMGVTGIKKSVLSYFNRVNGIHIVTFDVLADEAVFSLLVDRISRVIKKKGLLPDTRECQYCPFSYVCPSYKRPQWTKKSD